METSPPVFITTYTDASFCPNSKVGGWAAYIRTDTGAQEYSGTLQQSKSATEAEIKAACNALAHAIKLVTKDDDFVIVLVTDCLEVQKIINQKRMFGHANPCSKWISTFFSKTPPNVTIRAKKVKAHSNHDGARSWVNNRVDELAKIQMRSIRPKDWHKMEVNKR